MTDTPLRVAMVCLGNICRSPMAAAVAAAMVDREGLASRVHVESFGTAGYHAGEGADPRATDALERRGWPPSDHCARRLTAADVEAADLVLCADRANLRDVHRLAGGGEQGKIRLLRSFDPSAGPGDQDVPDPWDGGTADFDRALALIERACHGLVAHLAEVAG